MRSSGDTEYKGYAPWPPESAIAIASSSIPQNTGVGFVTSSWTRTPLAKRTPPASCPFAMSSGI
jgi:hypothetical protein